jgi:hypothetical protein
VRTVPAPVAAEDRGIAAAVDERVETILPPIRRRRPFTGMRLDVSAPDDDEVTHSGRAP